MSDLLAETLRELRDTKCQLDCTNKELAQLKEFDGDVHRGLDEIARQRAFMAEIGALLARGSFEVEDKFESS
jgi:hypothetical protein